MVVFTFLILLLFTYLTVYVNTLLVYTENGVLSGTTFKTSQGRLVNAFLGVPYAQPPVDELRFEEPQPPDNWKGIRPAHNFSSKCIQYRYHTNRSDPIVGDEDCLYLNIFTPILSNTTKLNVIFYIHGGAFMFGSGDTFTPDYILDHHDIVFVSVNYRLGPFGFLTTEDGVIPGNNGLKDQVMALKWVQKNIEQFGGDKHKVTIAGLSAGGASVHLHYFSPLSRNLFHKGISISGSAFCPWVLAENNLFKAKTLAHSIGCMTLDTKLLRDCLKVRAPKRLLLQTQYLFLPWNFNPFSPFGFVIEKESETAFLSRHPYELLKDGNVKNAPWLTSMTTEEGLYPGAFFVKKEKLLKELDKKWYDVLPYLLDFNHTVHFHQKHEVSEKIRKFYFKDKEIGLTLDTQKQLILMISERLFAVDIERAARLQALATPSPVYFYNFAYRGKYSFSDSLCKCSANLGASHGDDLIYLLNVGNGLSPLETDEDQEMVNTMINIWTSFTYSDVPSVGPHVDWVPVSPDAAAGGNLTYLLISSSENIKLISSADLSNHQFWDSLPFIELWNAVIKNRRHDDEL